MNIIQNTHIWLNSLYLISILVIVPFLFLYTSVHLFAADRISTGGYRWWSGLHVRRQYHSRVERHSARYIYSRLWCERAPNDGHRCNAARRKRIIQCGSSQSIILLYNPMHLNCQYTCCGAIRFEDWQSSDWFQRNDSAQWPNRDGRLVPDSCCLTLSERCGQSDHPSNIPYTVSTIRFIAIRITLYIINVIFRTWK